MKHHPSTTSIQHHEISPLRPPLWLTVALAAGAFNMADMERTILDFYQLSNPYPVEWPAEKDTSDVSEDDEAKVKANRRKSRYQALEKAVGNRNSLLPPGHQKSANGVGNIVQKDEPDPLGTTDSVVRTLKQLGVPVQEDPRLRAHAPPCLDLASR